MTFGYRLSHCGNFRHHTLKCSASTTIDSIGVMLSLRTIYTNSNINLIARKYVKPSLIYQNRVSLHREINLLRIVQTTSDERNHFRKTCNP